MRGGVVTRRRVCPLVIGVYLKPCVERRLHEGARTLRILHPADPYRLSAQTVNSESSAVEHRTTVLFYGWTTVGVCRMQDP
jgi:hypothetical protein